MNDVVKSLLERRSVRAYMQRQVPLDVVKQIVEAGRFAPNAMHQEPWHFTVLRNAEKLDELDTLVDGKGGSSFFYHAPTIVIVSIEKGNAFALQDTGCAMTNMMQASHALGIASVWCNKISRVEADYTLYGVPEGYKPTAALALGYSAISGASEWKVKEGTVTIVE
jgi:nitroreductase